MDRDEKQSENESQELPDDSNTEIFGPGHYERLICLGPPSVLYGDTENASEPDES